VRRFWIALVFSVGCGGAPATNEPVDASLPPVEKDSGIVARDGGFADAGFDRDSGLVDVGVIDAGVIDAGTPDSGAPLVRDPVLFIHGIDGSSAEFDVMRGRFEADGWAAEQLFAIDFEDPKWGCNIDNADAIATEVMRIQSVTGAARIDLVAHSMGTLSSRHFVKQLGGMDLVNTYVTLGGLHHGNRLSCLNPLDVCVWQELCPRNPFLMSLNADPATPGNLAWVSIYSTDDETVPVTSSHLDGAENIEVSGVPHAGPGGLTEDEAVYLQVRRVLEYPAW
jgi:triacylglycerol lipase